jgi:putative ABC transport system substrate-binding protein
MGLGVTVRLFEVHVAEGLARVFEDASRWPADGLYALGDSLLNSAPARVMDPAIQRRWPTIGARQYVDAGALMSCRPNALDQDRRAAGDVDQILRGANRADLPTQPPTVFHLVINVTAARTLGLSVPPSAAPLVRSGSNEAAARC